MKMRGKALQVIVAASSLVRFGAAQQQGACCKANSFFCGLESSCLDKGGTFQGENTACISQQLALQGCKIRANCSSFEDISMTGTPLYLDDDSCKFVPMGTSFQFFGMSHNKVGISSNGLLGLSPADLWCYAEQPIPTPWTPNNFIAALWDDLCPPGGGAVQCEAFQDRFVVQWTSAPECCWSEGPSTFQAVLFFDSGCVEFHCGDLFLTDGASGVENPDGARGVEVPIAPKSEGLSCD